MLKTIERITRQPIDPMQLPSAKIINEQRVINFKHRITDTLNNQELSIFEELILNYQKEHEIDAFKIASVASCEFLFLSVSSMRRTNLPLFFLAQR